MTEIKCLQIDCAHISKEGICELDFISLLKPNLLCNELLVCDEYCPKPINQTTPIFSKKNKKE